VFYLYVYVPSLKCILQVIKTCLNNFKYFEYLLFTCCCVQDKESVSIKGTNVMRWERTGLICLKPELRTTNLIILWNSVADQSKLKLICSFAFKVTLKKIICDKELLNPAVFLEWEKKNVFPFEKEVNYNIHCVWTLVQKLWKNRPPCRNQPIKINWTYREYHLFTLL